jgi:hypothetical protein
MPRSPWYGPYIRVTVSALTQAVKASRRLPAGKEEFSIQHITHTRDATVVRRLVFRCHRPGRAVEFLRNEWVARLPRGAFAPCKEEL